MKRLISMLLALLFAFSGIFAFALTVPAFADDNDDNDDDDDGLQLNIGAVCFSGEIDFPADEEFFVRHGWVTGPSGLSPAELAAFLDPSTTRFDLLVDGDLVESEHSTRFEAPDNLFTRFTSEFDDDFEGTHDFTGKWYLDGLLVVGGNPGEAVLQLTCELTVHFVDFGGQDD